jgi:chemotaxis protein CheD
MTASTTVRIGELSASRTPGSVLAAIGLGSCIGLVLIDAGRGAVGLAHIMLPDSRGQEAGSARFADVAVPALVRQLTAIGARTSHLQAVLVGGAQLFAAAGGSTLEIGARNEEAVCAALEQSRIPVVASATGGRVGRTVWVSVDELTVTAREASGTAEELYRPSIAPTAGAARAASL